MDDDELVAEIHHAAAALSALHHRLLRLISRANERRCWARDGATDPGAWLVAELAVSHRTAAGWSEVAGRLEELPATADSLATGRLSFDQVRTLSRFARPEDDEALAAEAEGLSVNQLRRRGRSRESLDLTGTEQAHWERWLRWRWDESRHSLHLAGEIPDREGAVVVKALTRIALHTPPEPTSGVYESFEARCADALVQMASQSLGADGDPDRSCVVVHVDAQALARPDGVGHVEDGPSLAVETVRRWACDGRWQVVVGEGHGQTIGVGRTSRRVPAWLGRLVKDRDRGCRFPGCERTLWVHAHHLVHWLELGPTDLDNLVTLCGYHHRLVHEHGWHIAGDPNKQLTWIRPNGRPYEPRPDVISPEARRRSIEYALEHADLRGSAWYDTS